MNNETEVLNPAEKPEDLPLQVVLERHRADERAHMQVKAQLLDEKRRMRWTLWAVIAVAIAGILSSWKPIELYEYWVGSRMTYEVNTPFPIIDEPIYPGRVVRFTVFRNSDFAELTSNWSLFRVADRNSDGRDEADRVESGRNIRVLTPGKVEYIVEHPLPDWIKPGKYYITYLADVSERSYHRKVSSRTKEFIVLPQPPKP